MGGGAAGGRPARPPSDDVLTASPRPRSATPRVAVDAMGGDAAPRVVVAGALRALARGGVEVTLVGHPRALADAVAELGVAPDELPIVPAHETVGMDEGPVLATRAKPSSSIRVATGLLAAGRVDAVLSAGSTGATLAATLLDLGRLPGVRRPALAAAIPLRDGGATVLVDAGASADVGAELLPGYARMGVAYAGVRGDTPTALGGDEPLRVGLLNVGAEAGKGNALARAARELLEDVAGFVGNVEPADVLAGAVDVVVSDGFTGNVFLKTLEAAGAGREEAARAGTTAPLLGVAGEVLVAHGAATADDIAAGIRAAAAAAGAGLSDRVAERLAVPGAPSTSAPASDTRGG